MTPQADALVTGHRGVVARVLRGLSARLPSHVDRDDLMSAGYAGLVQAARQFDPDRGIPFPAYAAQRIRGAMLDELRAADWASRSVRSGIRRRTDAECSLSMSLGRAPTRGEVASALVTSTPAVDASRRDEVCTQLEALDDATHAVAEDSPLELLLGREELAYLRDAVAALPAALREVIVGRYQDGRTLRELAAHRGLTEARMSQLHGDALKLLREALTFHLDEPGRSAADGIAARRRQTYFVEVGRRSAWRDRLVQSATELH